MTLFFLNLIVLLVVIIPIGATFKKYNLTNNKFILILVILLIFNITITFKFIQVKSNLNTSTYMAYNLVRDAFSKINYPNKIENQDDMRKLAAITREIHKNLEILELNLRSSKLTPNNKDFHALINELKNSLNRFITQHNEHFGNSETVTSQQLAQYEKLKVELVMIEYYLSQLGSSQSNQFGIQQYRIGLMGKEKYDWYSKLAERISNLEETVGN